MKSMSAREAIEKVDSLLQSCPSGKALCEGQVRDLGHLFETTVAMAGFIARKGQTPPPHLVRLVLEVNKTN